AGIAVVQPQANGSTTMIFPHIANGAPCATGLGLMNATVSTASVEVFAVRSDGTLIGSAPAFTLNAGAKTARLLSELIPATQNVNGGFVFVRSSAPIFGLELFTLRSGGPIANVPASGLPAGVVFTPPA